MSTYRLDEDERPQNEQGPPIWREWSRGLRSAGSVLAALGDRKRHHPLRANSQAVRVMREDDGVEVEYDPDTDSMVATGE